MAIFALVVNNGHISETKSEFCRVPLPAYFSARKRLKAVCKHFNLSEIQINILAFLSDLRSASPSQCGINTGVAYANILKHVNGLAEAGYIVMTKKRDYAQAPNLYSITRSGREVLQYYSDLEEEEIIKARQNTHRKNHI